MIKCIQSIYISVIVYLGTMVFAGLLQAAEGARDRVPSALIGVPDGEYALIVEKKTQKLYVFESRQAGVSLKLSFSCSTGEVAGPKIKAGDKKTPEGVYFLNDEYEDKYLSAVYGKKAFPSDYPNFMDQRQGRNGSAIWIHGTDKPLKPMDSNGCIALENKNIMALSDYIHLNGTALIIVKDITYAHEADLAAERKNAVAFISRWARAVETGSYHEYLSLYHNTYFPDMTWWEAWRKLRKTAVDEGQPLRIGFENTGIYAHGDMVVVLTRMFLGAGDERQILGKRQYFIKNDSKGPLIVGDLFKTIAPAYGQAQSVLTAAASDLIGRDTGKSAVMNTIFRWLAAWSARDMEAYARFYDDGFYGDGLGKTAWVRRKKRLAARYDYISVTGSGYKTIKRKTGYEVRFIQTYKSSGFSAQGQKKLLLVKKGGEWKIYRESWKKK